MRLRTLLATVALAAAAASAMAAPARNWLASVATTPSGSFVVGNPNAKVKLVEYLSYTCNHCAAFVNEASAPLKRDYVARGSTSIEVRHALRDRLDFTAALLARCDGPARFLGHSEAIFAAQEDWMAKGIAFEGSNEERLRALPIGQALGQLAAGSGLEALMHARGMAHAKITACLASTAQQTALANMADEAWSKRKIQGTPAFFINDAPVPNAGTWAALKPRLDEALK